MLRKSTWSLINYTYIFQIVIIFIGLLHDKKHLSYTCFEVKKINLKKSITDLIGITSVSKPLYPQSGLILQREFLAISRFMIC